MDNLGNHLGISPEEAKKLNDLLRNSQIKGSKVYVKQPNSGIFFQTPVIEVQKQILKILNDKQ